jgi:hypothetical protein
VNCAFKTLVTPYAVITSPYATLKIEINRSRLNADPHDCSYVTIRVVFRGLPLFVPYRGHSSW